MNIVMTGDQVMYQCHKCNIRIDTEQEERRHLLFTHGFYKEPCSTGLAAKQFKAQKEKEIYYTDTIYLLACEVKREKGRLNTLIDLLTKIQELLIFFKDSNIQKFPNRRLKNAINALIFKQYKWAPDGWVLFVDVQDLAKEIHVFINKYYNEPTLSWKTGD